MTGSGLPASAGADERILVLALRGRDAQVIAQALRGDAMQATVCESAAALLAGMDAGAGAALITEESLDALTGEALQRWLGHQPPWSDFPFIVLGATVPVRHTEWTRALVKGLGNAVLLERPLSSDTLVSAARSALRSRQRQYTARQHLEEQARNGQENERLYRAAQSALDEAASAREALSLAVDAAELGTFHCPMPLGPIEWNDTCKKHFWLPPQAQVDFQVFYDQIHPDDRERVRAAVQACVSGRGPYDVEYRTVSPRGECRWIRAKGQTYFDAQGEPLRFDGITIDISRQKEVESTREAMLRAERTVRAQAEEASRAKDEFLATLSHELRTPLSAILGWCYLLKRRAAGQAELLHGVETIERSARAQARLVDDLLDMSRIVAGNVRLELQPVNAALPLDAALASLRPLAAAQQVQLEAALDAPDATVMADPHRLQQIAWNLLSNAIKFTPAGGSVRLMLATQGEQAVIEVTDTGEGVSPDFLPFMFDRFRQADGSSRRSHGGLGLGLAIVRHLVELHGGQITAASDGLGRGTTMRIRLPLARDATPAPGAVDTSGGAVAPGALRGARILLVDDEADSLLMLLRILTDAGAKVVPAHSADEALTLLHDAPPDILISDIGMPRVDGYDLVRTVRAFGFTGPAVALTAFARAEDRSRALAAGYTQHLAKPVEPGALVAAVAQLLEAGSGAQAGGSAAFTPLQPSAEAEAGE